MDSNVVVTRFAPSPTGALHVGGARSALFPWAFARRHGGRFIVRMEDTDRARSSVASAQSILRDLTWLGLDWDEGPKAEAEDPYDPGSGQRGGHAPYFQSQRLESYREHVERLLGDGRAYEDGGAVRFKMGRDVSFRDEVYGEVKVEGKDLEDFVVMKSDGFPTYHLGVVVDDASMGVTHVFRGQEHLYNTPKHVALQEALGFPRPHYAHMPSILNPDGSKMSKRDKAKAARKAAGEARLTAGDLSDSPLPTAEAFDAFMNRQSDDLAVAEAIARRLGLSLPEIDVADFRRSGYLASTLCNYLSLLGWSPGGDCERFDLAFLVENLDFERMGRKNAKFDRDKLFRFNGDDLAAMSAEDFTARWRGHCERYDRVYVQRLDADTFRRLATAYQPRSRTLQEPCDLARFFVAADTDVVYDAKATAKWLEKNAGEGFRVLEDLRGRLAALPSFDPPAIEALVGEVAASTGLGMGKVAQPLRVAVTGSVVSPGIGDTLSILGREHVLARIDRCLAQREGS